MTKHFFRNLVFFLGIDFGVRQTRLIHVSEPPRFDEKFQFTLADAESYVNLVLWCKCPEVLDKGISTKALWSRITKNLD